MIIKFFVCLFLFRSVKAKNIGYSEEEIKRAESIQSEEVMPNILLPKSIYNQCKLNESLCFGYPENCVQNENCQILSTAVKADDNETIHFKLSAQLNILNNYYIAMSLSDKPSMNGNVVYCYINELGLVTPISMGVGYIKGRKVIHLNSVDGIHLRSIALEDNLLSCEWLRQAKTVVNQHEYDLIHNKYYLELAKGPMKGEKLTHHDARIRSSQRVDLESVK